METENTRRMIKTHPVHSTFLTDELVECISQCFDCAQVCTSCADACLNEDSVMELRRCIRLNLDCADICLAAGSILSRQGSVSDEIVRDQLRACKAACDICGKECKGHDHHEHCIICSDSCFACRDACGRVLSSMTIEVP